MDDEALEVVVAEQPRLARARHGDVERAQVLLRGREAVPGQLVDAAAAAKGHDARDAHLVDLEDARRPRQLRVSDRGQPELVGELGVDGAHARARVEDEMVRRGAVEGQRQEELAALIDTVDDRHAWPDCGALAPARKDSR